MKQTSNATKGRKTAVNKNSASSKTQQNRTSSRQGSASEKSSPRANSSSNNGSRTPSASQKNSNQQGSNHQGSFQGESHLEKFFLDQLQDIYYAEQKILQNLPKMAEAATTNELKEAFEDHLHQTQRHVKRLEQVFKTLNQKPEGKKCEAIEGIAREVENIIGETEEGTMTRDAALIIAAQKVEHYEIATYGGLVQLAITMQLHDAADLLDKTLVEEEDTDALLTEIAENDINLQAEHEGGQNESGEENNQEDEDVDEESPNL
ncbi:MAG: DUF892 family protein [Bacteroidetes bacterium]|nr:DUF892 family protein [Bacteroidota bacterium]